MSRLLLGFLLFFPFFAFPQTDSLVLNNGDAMVGEIKSMDRGVLIIETPYSDADFKIEWEKISKVKAQNRYIIYLSDSRRIIGKFQSSNEGEILILDEDGAQILIPASEVVYINSLDDTFLSRLSANIDFGLSLTKANNQRQINSNFRLGYTADRWLGNLYYNTLFTNQDGVDDIERNDGGLAYRYFLPADWYLSADLNFLSNTEQSIELRSTGMIGIGKYVIRTNKSYWGFSIGSAFNNETFNTIVATENNEAFTEARRQSLEGYITTELNLYDIGDLSLFTSLVVYPSIIAPEDVDPGRLRADWRFDAKYDDVFIDDFYIRASFTLNYDNRPADPSRETDYIFTSGFGWSW